MTEESGLSLLVDVQYAVQQKEGHELPSSEQISLWANSAYQSDSHDRKEVTVRLVDRTEMSMLNHDYRGKESATNVLSFSFDVDPVMELALLGDVVICHAVVVEEAAQQGKKLDDHYAHMITHGILHLCGYDHERENDAQQMETLEISLLENLGISNPYSH